MKKAYTSRIVNKQEKIKIYSTNKQYTQEMAEVMPIKSQENPEGIFTKKI